MRVVFIRMVLVNPAIFTYFFFSSRRSLKLITAMKHELVEIDKNISIKSFFHLWVGDVEYLESKGFYADCCLTKIRRKYALLERPLD